jgi:L-alanine-DL-glutamate epimerase-like enolase superfamily enzyme
MVITGVETYLLDSVGVPGYQWREQGVPVFAPGNKNLWVRVVTSEGIDGWSNLDYWGTIGVDLVDRRLRDLFVGRDPLMKEALWHRIWELDRIEELPLYVLGMIDVALWDITAKVAGLPLYKVLGGARDRIPCYASTATWDTVEEYLDVADQCLDLGFTAIKLHAWGDLRRDTELCRRLREHVGDEIVLMYDGSAAFGPADALRLGRELEDLGYYWYEEPMREFQLEAYRRLADVLEIPVLAAETTEGVHYTAAEFLATGAADLVRTGWWYKGGITGSLRIAHLADAFGTTAEVHGGDLPNLHLCCAIQNTTFYESMVLENPVQKEARIDEEGVIHAPTAPGIGWEVDPDRLRSMAIAVGG